MGLPRNSRLKCFCGRRAQMMFRMLAYCRRHGNLLKRAEGKR